MIYHAALAEYFNLSLLSSLRSSLAPNRDCLLHLVFTKCFSLLRSLSFLFLINMMASGFLTFNLPFVSMSSYFPTQTCSSPAPSLLLLLVLHWSKELTLVPGANHPIGKEDARPKNSSSSTSGVYGCSPSTVSAASSLSQYWFSLSSRRVEMIFPPSFLICWFLFHVLILPCNTDSYTLILKACTRYIPVFPYIQ